MIEAKTESDMSFLSSVLLGLIEKELESKSPEVIDFVIKQLERIGSDLLSYVEKKTNVSGDSSGV